MFVVVSVLNKKINDGITCNVTLITSTVRNSSVTWTLSEKADIDFGVFKRKIHSRRVWPSTGKCPLENLL
jgi:hypothetical protein